MLLNKLTGQGFANSFNALMNSNKVGFTAAIRLKSINRKIIEKLKDVDECVKAIFEQYGTRNDKGDLVLPSDPENEGRKKILELTNSDIDLEIGEKVVLKQEALDALSVNDLEMLEEIIFLGE